MDLFTYLRKNRVTQGEIAKEVGASLTTISNIVRQKRTPGLLLALKIFVACERKIDLGTMVNEEDFKELTRFTEKHPAK